MSKTRRDVLAGAAGLGALSLLYGASRAAPAPGRALQFGPQTAFTFETLKAKARMLAGRVYVPPAIRAGDTLQKIDYDAYGKIIARPDMAFVSDLPASPMVRFFHLHRFAKQAVKIYALEGNSAREILYSPEYFETPPDHPARALPHDLGFAGFRVLNEDAKGDWLAFQGASYFRSSGPLDQYGLSARGIALDTATPEPEEFPRFSAFWISLDGDHALTIHALLEGPSVTGAYKMATIRKNGEVVQEVQAALFMRKAVARLGVAPLTSMYWYGENIRTEATDWRPEIHDSDGLALWTGSGERIWRPLTNPPRVMTNSFSDENPRGFGLLQRDRVFDHYQDDGVYYDRRPSLWVEPLNSWGKGAVQLVEIPTSDEIQDNVVAYWVPEVPTAPGTSYDIAYRLHWLTREPFPAPVARVAATRLGLGGIPGQPRPKGEIKIVVDFEGERFAGLTRESGVSGQVSANRGQISNVAAYPVVGTGLWRLIFDLNVNGSEPVDLRAYVKHDNEPLSETWLYQLFPGEIGGKSGA